MRFRVNIVLVLYLLMVSSYLNGQYIGIDRSGYVNFDVLLESINKDDHFLPVMLKYCSNPNFPALSVLSGWRLPLFESRLYQFDKDKFLFRSPSGYELRFIKNRTSKGGDYYVAGEQFILDVDQRGVGVVHDRRGIGPVFRFKDGYLVEFGKVRGASFYLKYWDGEPSGLLWGGRREKVLDFSFDYWEPLRGRSTEVNGVNERLIHNICFQRRGCVAIGYSDFDMYKSDGDIERRLMLNSIEWEDGRSVKLEYGHLTISRSLSESDIKQYMDIGIMYGLSFLNGNVIYRDEMISANSVSVRFDINNKEAVYSYAWDASTGIVARHNSGNFLVIQDPVKNSNDYAKRSVFIVEHDAISGQLNSIWGYDSTRGIEVDYKSIRGSTYVYYYILTPGANYMNIRRMVRYDDVSNRIENVHMYTYDIEGNLVKKVRTDNY